MKKVEFLEIYRTDKIDDYLIWFCAIMYLKNIEKDRLRPFCFRKAEPIAGMAEMIIGKRGMTIEIRAEITTDPRMSDD